MARTTIAQLEAREKELQEHFDKQRADFEKLRADAVQLRDKHRLLAGENVALTERLASETEANEALQGVLESAKTDLLLLRAGLAEIAKGSRFSLGHPARARDTLKKLTKTQPPGPIRGGDLPGDSDTEY